MHQFARIVAFVAFRALFRDLITSPVIGSNSRRYGIW